MVEVLYTIAIFFICIQHKYVSLKNNKSIVKLLKLTGKVSKVSVYTGYYGLIVLVWDDPCWTTMSVYLIPLNYILQNGKPYVMYIILPFKTPTVLVSNSKQS